MKIYVLRNKVTGYYLSTDYGTSEEGLGKIFHSRKEALELLESSVARQLLIAQNGLANYLFVLLNTEIVCYDLVGSEGFMKTLTQKERDEMYEVLTPEELVRLKNVCN